MKRLLFFDIDGTLIAEHNHTIPESAVRAIKEAKEKGHICMVNTGRSEALVGDFLQKQVEFDGYLIGCGTRITYKGQVLFEKHLSEKEGRVIIDALEKNKIDYILEGTDNCYCKDPEEMYSEVFRDYARHFREWGFGTLEEAIGKFDKFYCYAGSQEVMNGFLADSQGIMDAIDREKGFFEVVPKGFSKASGMKFMADYLGMDMSQTVAIGDSNNDRTMMEAAGFSIAMGNATQGIKDLADFVTDDVTRDGIYKALSIL